MEVRGWMVIATISVAGCYVPQGMSAEAGTSGAHDGASDDDEPDDEDDGADDSTGEVIIVECDVLRRHTLGERVIVDVELACNDTIFAEWGMSVVALDDAVMLATASFYESWVVRMDESNITTLDDAPTLAAQRPRVAVDDTGRIFLAGHREDAAIVAMLDDAWHVERIDLGGDKEVVGLQAYGDGNASAWFEVGGQIDRVRHADGAWSRDERVSTSGHVRFDLAHDGTEVTYEMIEDLPTASWELVTRIGSGKTKSLGATIPGLWSPVSGASAPDGAALPELGAISAQIGGLEVEWTDGTATRIDPIPGTQLRAEQCPETPEYECLPPCHETSRGIDDDAFAAARTTDGTTWIAFVESTADYVKGGDEWCDETKGSCGCSGWIDDDRSTRALVIRTLTRSGSSAEAFRVPLGAMGDDTPRIDVHARGSMLAIAVSVDESEIGSDGASAIRTLLVDTGHASEWAE